MKRILLTGTLLFAFAGSAQAGESAMPTLAAADWTGKPVILEDLRGLVTVLCFYDDNLS